MKKLMIAALALPLLLATPAHANGGHHGGGGHYGHHGGYRHGGWGWWGAPVIVGGVLIGGIATAAAVAEHRADVANMRRCAAEFPTFTATTGTYVGPDGIARVCPYLY